MLILCVHSTEEGLVAALPLRQQLACLQFACCPTLCVIRCYLMQATPNVPAGEISFTAASICVTLNSFFHHDFVFYNLGDPNVPAGEISFTASIDRAARLDVGEYPEIMGVTGRYAGKGLVAQPGFTEPRCDFSTEVLHRCPFSISIYAIALSASTPRSWASPAATLSRV